MRIALGIEYNGYEFHGWQTQENLPTIQGSLEAALSKIAAQPIQLFCAGRTDAGVHATGQVVHFDTEVFRPAYAWMLGTNSYLPHAIAVRWVQEVTSDFHARFSAVARRYRYVIYNNPMRPAILAKRATWHRHPLDEKRMQTAGNYLLGEHDFSSFRSSQCEAKSPIRCVQEFTVTRHGDFVVIEIQANAFLQHMVRNLAGTLMRIGSGTQEPEWMKTILDAKNRTVAAETAPADGLYLIQVFYPAAYAFPMGQGGMMFF